jgi:phosphatidylserine/phosphatidylglycerophosphate/cardiolipin synthase-like enzyme
MRLLAVLTLTALGSCNRSASSLDASSDGSDLYVAISPGASSTGDAQVLLASAPAGAAAVTMCAGPTAAACASDTAVALTPLGAKYGRSLYTTPGPVALGTGQRFAFTAKDGQGAVIASRAVMTVPPRGRVSLFMTPSSSGHQDFVAAIDRATATIKMTMFHLTEAAPVQALIRAQQRGVQVRLILDGKGLAARKNQSTLVAMRNAGIAVKASSPAFPITHEKAMVVDDDFVLITTINLTDTAADTRDFGVGLADPGIIAEFGRVFETDWQNADTGSGATPTVSEPDLLWSPVNSQPKLKALVDSATATIDAYGENLGDQVIQAALIAAAARGVAVRIMAPQCDKNTDTSFDLPFLTTMRTGGVDARAMPTPSAPDEPYIHAKVMVVDGKIAYLGSVNYNTRSTTENRELGLLIRDADAIATLAATFAADFPKAILPIACTQ